MYFTNISVKSILCVDNSAKLIARNWTAEIIETKYNDQLILYVTKYYFSYTSIWYMEYQNILNSSVKLLVTFSTQWNTFPKGHSRALKVCSQVWHRHDTLTMSINVFSNPTWNYSARYSSYSWSARWTLSVGALLRKDTAYIGKFNPN